MIVLDKLPFRAVSVVDFEYCQPDGGLPDPLCVVAKDVISGVKVARWLEKDDPGPVPYDTGPQSLFVAHAASAETLCSLVLDWPLPTYVLDTYASFRCLKNGSDVDRGASLLVAASRYNIPTITSAAKAAGREIAIKGRAHAEGHREELLHYCGTDVDANAKLFVAMLPEILNREQGLPHHLIFGEYMKAVASMDLVGVPIDAVLLGRLQRWWPQIRSRLIGARDAGVTDCYVEGRFNKKRFEALLQSLGQLDTWPRTETGQVSLEDGVFRRRAHGHPLLKSLYELHYTLDKLRTLTLHVGPDRRHRAVGSLGAGAQKRSAGLSPFGTKTGRNAPKGFIFAPAVWVRHLVQPEPGWCVVYSDYEAEEPHVAARVSNDPNLAAAVESGDPYTWHAKKTGLAPPNASKQSHRNVRDSMWKPSLLSQFYGTTSTGLSAKLSMSKDYAEYRLIRPYHELYKTYWDWSRDAMYSAINRGFIRTRFGWTMRITDKTKPRTLLNWPIQATGADILRLAVIGMVRNGIRVCAPVHDAVLTECRIEEVEEHKAAVQRIMRQAARVVIGHEIPVDSKAVRHPDRYTDSRGTDMFNTIMQLLGDIEAEEISSVRADIYRVYGGISFIRI